MALLSPRVTRQRHQYPNRAKCTGAELAMTELNFEAMPSTAAFIQRELQPGHLPAAGAGAGPLAMKDPVFLPPPTCTPIWFKRLLR